MFDHKVKYFLDPSELEELSFDLLLSYLDSRKSYLFCTSDDFATLLKKG